MGRLLRRAGPPANSPLFALPPCDPAALHASTVDVLLVHASGIRNRARVLKIIDSLRGAGRSVACLSKLPPGAPDERLRCEEIEGVTVVYAPDAHDFAGGRGRRTAAQGWPRMVAHLETALWPVAERFAPRVIQTFDAAAIGIGHSFRDRLRSGGHRTAWFHDFTEHTAGHRFGETRDDDDWRSVVVGHEAAHARAMDRAFCVSPDVAAAVQEQYRLARPPTVLLNVPRRSDWDPSARPTVRESLGLARQTPLIVYSGGVTRLRGLHTLVSALTPLDGVHAVMITESDSGYFRQLLAAARKAGCAGRLHVLPYLPPAAVPSFLRDATIGVHPMIRYGNGDKALPNKLFDYIHAGLPVVVPEGTAMGRLAARHGLGTTFPPEDDAGLAEAIRRILEGPDFDGPPEAVLAEYSWERQEPALLAPYAEAFA